jgi:hypothetical protein
MTKEKSKSLIEITFHKQILRKLYKEVKWLYINIPRRVLEGNILIDLGILAYAFKTTSWDKVIAALPFFFAFLIICLFFVGVIAVGDALIVNDAKRTRGRGRI